jgi:AcrR family transcriptional regulator
VVKFDGVTPPTSRRDAVLAAAVHVLGTGGSRALTHRAVDRAAGVPEGTTSNHFRTRKALVAGVLEFISAAEAAPIRGRVPDGGLSVEELVTLSAERVEFLLGPGRTLTLARHTLFLEAALDPQLRPALLAASQPWWDLGARLLGELGVPDAARRSRWLFAYIDGLLADELARPSGDFDAAAAVRAGITGLLAGSRHGRGRRPSRAGDARVRARPVG